MAGAESLHRLGSMVNAELSLSEKAAPGHQGLPCLVAQVAVMLGPQVACRSLLGAVASTGAAVNENRHVSGARMAKPPRASYLDLFHRPVPSG
jgi:hypothetical protein